MKIVRIRSRDIIAGTILVERCALPLALRSYAISDLEDGIDTVGPCQYCGESLEMDLALAGDVWPLRFGGHVTPGRPENITRHSFRRFEASRSGTPRYGSGRAGLCLLRIRLVADPCRTRG